MKLLEALRTRNGARIIAGLGLWLLSLIILIMMYAKPELAKDDLFKMLGQAIIIQGLIGASVWLFNSRPSGNQDEGQG